MTHDPDALAGLLAQAESILISKRNVAALGGIATVALLTSALERAIGSARLHASTVLALAIGVAGGRIPARLVNQLLPDLDDIDLVTVIAGIVEGDRLGALLDVIAEGQLSWEREAVLLYLATQLLDGAEPPPRLITQLRSLSREPLSAQAAMVAGLAARALKNQELNTLTSRFASFAMLAEHRGLDAHFRARFFGPVLDSLPEDAGGRLVSGYTVVRTDPKVGRNDPCPCGSGRKYKKCCATREQDLPVAPSMAEQFQKLAAQGPRAQERIFEALRPGELAQLDPEKLTTLQLILGARKLANHHRWEPAARFHDVLSTRTDAPHGDPHGYRAELAEDALRAGLLELAEQQMQLARPSESTRARFDLQIALARNAPDALTRLESRARQGHDGDPILLADVAFALLDHFPALGILAARGSLNADHLLDSDTLLDSIGKARDQLGLSAIEPWDAIFDTWLEGEIPRWSARASGPAGENPSKRDEQLERLQADLSEATARVSRLNGELETRERQLDAISGEREKPVALVETGPGIDERKRVAELEAERQRLRSKIAELKGEVSAGATQRAELRRELARATDLQRRQQAAPAPSEQHPHHDDDDAEGDAVGERPRRILVPQFSAAASRALASVPARVAGDALQEAARLAGGDAAAWSGAKHMRRAHEILSVRIGRTYRLLFRIADDHLDVVDLIHRRELDQSIQRLAGR